MRAAGIVAPGRLELVEVARPDPGLGRVRIRLEGCGVCASNLPIWEGKPSFEYPLAPGAPGHEGWGIVDDLADAAGVVPVPESLAGQALPVAEILDTLYGHGPPRTGISAAAAMEGAEP